MLLNEMTLPRVTKRRPEHAGRVGFLYIGAKTTSLTDGLLENPINVHIEQIKNRFSRSFSLRVNELLWLITCTAKIQ